MPTKTVPDFEALYCIDPDPWNYLLSGYERDKYAVTLHACGPGPFGCALELGGSIGVFSAMLAPRCKRLLTVDVAPTAVTRARNRLAQFPQAEALVAVIPDQIPDEPFDLVIASEILCYLTDEELARTVAVLRRTVVPGGRIVAVNWRPTGPDRPQDAEQAHAPLRAAPWLTRVLTGGTDDYLLEVFER